MCETYVHVFGHSNWSGRRSKHIDVRFHFVRELLRAKKIDIQFVTSEEQHVDILTKSVAATLINLTVVFR